MDSKCCPFTIFKPVVLVKHTYFKNFIISSLHPVTLKLLNLIWNEVMLQLVIYVLMFLNIEFIHVLLIFSVQAPSECFVGGGYLFWFSFLAPFLCIHSSKSDKFAFVFFQFPGFLGQASSYKGDFSQ